VFTLAPEGSGVRDRLAALVGALGHMRAHPNRAAVENLMAMGRAGRAEGQAAAEPGFAAPAARSRLLADPERFAIGSPLRRGHE
jgi:hypothetical protein